MNSTMWFALAGCLLRGSPDEDKDGFSIADGDCDDQEAKISPKRPEICDGLDNDCDGIVDGAPEDGDTYFVDDDGDGYGSDDRTLDACSRPDGYEDEGGDCDDDDEHVNPGADDTQEEDRDCDGEIEPPGTTPTTGDCPWVGTWMLDTLYCSTFPYDPWYDEHDSATLEIAHHPSTGCLVTATIAGASCAWTESWTFSLPVGTTVEVTFDSITACEPSECSFGAIDNVVCLPGDLDGGPRQVGLTESGGTLSADGLLTERAPGCPLSVFSTWNREQ